MEVALTNQNGSRMGVHKCLRPLMAPQWTDHCRLDGCSPRKAACESNPAPSSVEKRRPFPPAGHVSLRGRAQCHSFVCLPEILLNGPNSFMAGFMRAPSRYFAEYQLSARAENLRPDTGLRSSFRRLTECCTGRAAIVEQLAVQT